MALNMPVGLGLFGGKTGAAIFMYLYSRHASSRLWEDEADLLPDDILKGINGLDSEGLPAGMPGVALGLHYMVANGFVESSDDVDKLFSRLDKRLAGNLLNGYNPSTVETGDYFPVSGYLVCRLDNGVLNDGKLELVKTSLEVIDRIYGNGGADKTIGLRYTFSVLMLLDSLLQKNIYNTTVLRLYDNVCEHIEEFAVADRILPADIKVLEAVRWRAGREWHGAGMYDAVLEKYGRSSDIVTAAGYLPTMAEGRLLSPMMNIWADIIYGSVNRQPVDPEPVAVWIDRLLEDTNSDSIGKLIGLGLWILDARLLPSVEEVRTGMESKCMVYSDDSLE